MNELVIKHNLFSTNRLLAALISALSSACTEFTQLAQQHGVSWSGTALYMKIINQKAFCV